jgi:flagellar protein FliO/FliZ
MQSMSWSLLMLVLVLGSIPLALWAVKRLQTLKLGAGVRELEVLAQLALGARERVLLVRVQERVLVLGVTAQQISLLAEAQLPAAAPAAPADFAGLLKSLRAVSRLGGNP